MKSVEGAGALRSVAKLFSKSLGGRNDENASELTLPGFNTVGWLGNETLAFLAATDNKN